MKGTASACSNQSAHPLEEQTGQRAGTFAPFDLGVEDILHVGAAGVAKDGTIAEGARAPFHPALEPAHHSAVRDGLRSTQAELASICIETLTAPIA